MKIPKIVYRNNHTYTFIKQCNPKVFLYESELGFKETFTAYDLGILNNKRIDKKMGIRTWSSIIYVLYDRLMEEEKEYRDIHIIANELNVSYEKVRKNIRDHSWINNRWFVERRYL